MPFTGPKDPVVHLNDLTGMAKGRLLKQTWPCVWFFWLVQELSFNVTNVLVLKQIILLECILFNV